jgi:preprotein translocase subunit SecD
VKNRNLWVSLILLLVVSFGGAGLALATSTSPVLGLDLQGGFSVVLQAREVDGKLPSEEAVEKAKDIIRQRVDGLGVAEPDITRQGRTVVVQLPGVKNRAQAESVVGCTAKLEFRPLISTDFNPDAPLPEVSDPTTGTTEADGSTTTTAGDASSTTTEAPGDDTTDTTEAGLPEIFGGTAGIAVGEGAVPVQFAPTTTAPPATTTTTAPETATTVAETTTTAPDTATTAPGDTTTTTAPTTAEDGSSSSACGSSASRSLPIDPEEGLPEGAVKLLSEDETLIYTLGPVGMEGDGLNEASAVLNQGQWVVTTSVRSEFRDQATTLFDGCALGDPACPGRAVAIVLDGEVLSAPTVQETGLASSENFQISGQFSEREAKELALVLRYGSLPVEFEQAALQQVSATLGSDSLRAGLIAGVIGILALALYMVLYYRGFGMVVVVSLLVWMALMYGVVCLLSETQGLALTLAGITGMIVSVGTTVDTYVVVFERVKDLVREGKSVRRATELGYQQGIRTVLTANGAAFIGAFLLWYLTVGPVRGFAYFLGISVIIDMVVAIAFTRPLILLLSRSKWFADAGFFGVATSTDQSFTSAKAVAP